MKILGIISIVVLVLLTACKNEVETIAYDYSDYLPTQVGKYRIYQVDSLILEPTFGDITTSHLVREEITEQFFDNENRASYRVLRSSRKAGSGRWIPQATWYITPNDYNVEQNEDNLTFIKQVYPPSAEKEWNGNILFEKTLVEDRQCSTDEFYQDWEYTYKNLHASTVIDTMSFDSTLTVVGVDDGNLIRKRFSEEVYAWKVGLIERTEYDLEYNGGTIPPTNIGWPDRANCGYTVTTKIVGHN